MRLLIPFLLFTTTLFAQIAVTENDPSALVEGIVSTAAPAKSTRSK